MVGAEKLLCLTFVIDTSSGVVLWIISLLAALLYSASRAAPFVWPKGWKGAGDCNCVWRKGRKGNGREEEREKRRGRGRGRGRGERREKREERREKREERREKREERRERERDGMSGLFLICFDSPL